MGDVLSTKFRSSYSPVSDADGMIRYSFSHPAHTYTHEQLLEPLEAHVARGHDDVRDVEHFPRERVGGGRGDVERAVPRGVRTGTEPHVLEHLHHQFSYALLVVYSSYHFNANFGNFRKLRTLYADVF